MEENISSSHNGESFKVENKQKLKKLVSFLSNAVGFTLFLLDIVLDIWTAVKFYREEAYEALAVLVVLLIGSSLLTHVYSWLWYKYDNFTMMTNLERIMYSYIGVLHIFQAGVYVRHAAIVTASIENFHCKSPDLRKIIQYRKHDLRILRIFESFSESAPQIVLMLTIALRNEGWILNVITVLKTLVSLLSITFSEAKYYRSLISFLPEETDQSCGSSCWAALRLVLYFIWKLLLLSCRLVALALFASVEPCYIFTHFVCTWLVLFFSVSYINTNFMKCTGGKWLFRSTLALIWYFSWFSGVVKGKTSKLMLRYHIYMLVDISVLCGVWYWRMSQDPPHFEISCLKVAITAAVVPIIYIFGLLCQAIYLFGLHPDGKEHPEPSLMDSVETDGGGWRCEKKKQKQPIPQKFEMLGIYLRYLFSCCDNQGKVHEFEPSEASRSNRRMEELAKSFYP
ncbi:XK-related protein 8-like [Anableps anableps]